MTAGKMTALGLALAGAFALGVWTGPQITQRADRTASVSEETGIVPGADSLPVETAAPARAARAATSARAATVDVSMPELQARLKPVLNRGANMMLAAEGFKSAEQFATVAHAARNTAVPFLLLKHRVLNEGKSVADAIHESKPAVDATVEAQLARAQARSDIAAIVS
jgi:hypothetical protein